MKSKAYNHLKQIIQNDRKEIKEEKYKPVKDLLMKSNYKPKFLFLSNLLRKIKR